MPPRGSPRDLVLRELLSREQSAKAAEMSISARLLAALAGVERGVMDRALAAYIEEITHARYVNSAKKVRPAPERDDAARRLAAVAALNSESE